MSTALKVRQFLKHPWIRSKRGETIFIVFFCLVFCNANCFGQTVTYPPTNSYITGTVITPLSPTVTGGTLDSYAVKPDLPEGLKLEPKTGVISGTPSKVVAEASYTITPTVKGITIKPVELKITVNPPKPIITYNADNKFTTGSSILELKPTNSGGAAVRYFISPTLPLNLNFNATEGIISGIPISPSPTVDYTVIAINASGASAPVQLKITITKDSHSNCSFAEIFSIIGIFIFCFLIISYLLVTSVNSIKNATEALGLPSGSIRAIIAILFVIFFVLLAVIFYFHSDSASNGSLDLAKQILTILGTLVTAVSAFYFGSKTSENAFTSAAAALNTPQNDGDIPLNIIQEAIQANKATWTTTYGCKDIAAGKKTSANTTHNINCIVFTVTSKNDLAGKTAIPPTISYVSNGTTYSIPTDVVEQQVKITLSLDPSVAATTATADMLKGAAVQVTLSGSTTPVTVTNNNDGTFTAIIITASSYTITGSLTAIPAGAVPLQGTMTVTLQPGTAPVTLLIK